jgi:murein DD-endopeptidase MepM/ murein hydrolase activator NlpD
VPRHTRTPSRHPAPRRALVEAPRPARRGWLQHGIAALAVSVLGVGVAGSIALTGNAQRTSVPLTAPAAATSAVERHVAPGVAQPDAFTPRTERASRGGGRPALTGTSTATGRAAAATVVRARAEQLAIQATATRKQAARLDRAEQARKAKKAKQRKAAEAAEASRRTLPVAGGYTIAARFGAVGSWSRYHTGFDFSAPVGTPVHTPDDGVVTTAGSGSASGWAGTYVTVRHGDGTTSLYAHLSTATVRVGEKVSAGQVVGRVGMTGRTFGPHLHFEVYPAGVEPGDVYRAVDPEPWLNALGLKP